MTGGASVGSAPTPSPYPAPGMPGGMPSGSAVPQYSAAPRPYGASGRPGYGAPPGGYPGAARTINAKPTDLGIAGCGLALFGFSFAPMATVGSYSSLGTLNGWHGGFRTFLVVAFLGLALAVVYGLKAFEVTAIPDRLVSFSLDQLAVVVGFVGVVVSLGTLLGLLDGFTVGWGTILSLLISVGLIVLGLLNVKEAGAL